MAGDDPKTKQISITLTEDATRALLDAAKSQLSQSAGSAENVFLTELQNKIAAEGIDSLVAGIGTSTKFHDVVSAGN